MRRLVHLSDLHFGRTRRDLLEPMVEAVNALRPDLVAVSGDLTQRARVRQFAEARDFLARLRAPVLVVPGNHDIPLDHPILRIFAPFSRYRRFIGTDLEPSHMDDHMVVVGLNTADQWAWQRGRIRRSSLRQACARLRGAGDARFQVVVAHHPFEQLPGDTKTPMPGADAALGELAACGAQIVLSGHLHVWRAAPFTRRADRPSVLQIQAGTGISTRSRGEANDFNLLTVDHGDVTVERYVAPTERPVFLCEEIHRFRQGPGGWTPETPAAAPSIRLATRQDGGNRTGYGTKATEI